MNKKVFLLLFYIFLFSCIYAEKILVAPVIVYNQRGEKQNNSDSELIFDYLSKYWFEGIITFERMKSDNFGEIYTVVDAQRVANANNVNFIIYGYFQKNDNYWFGNIKLFDKYRNRIVKEFYSSDEVAKYDRFFTNLINNILSGIEEYCGLSKEKTAIQDDKKIRMRIPCSFFYWTPIDSKWSTVYTGIIGTNVGFEIFPPFDDIVIKNFLLDFSAQIKLNYSYGIGKDNKYELNYNNIFVGIPITTYFHFSNIHCVYLGFGPFCEFEIMQVIKKYSDAEGSFQNGFVLNTSTGYELTVNEYFNLYSDFSFYFHMNTNSYITIQSGIGIVFNIN